MNTQPTLKFNSKKAPGSVLVSKLGTDNQYHFIGLITRLATDTPPLAKDIAGKKGDRIFFETQNTTKKDQPDTAFLLDPTYEGLKKKIIDRHG